MECGQSAPAEAAGRLPGLGGVAAGLQLLSGFSGLANTDEFVFADGKRGMTVRLFDRDKDQWWIHWAVAGRGTLDPPVIGSFKDGSGSFYGDDMHDDVPI